MYKQDEYEYELKLEETRKTEWVLYMLYICEIWKVFFRDFFGHQGKDNSFIVF